MTCARRWITASHSETTRRRCRSCCKQRRPGRPTYVLKAESGPDHRKRFLVEVRVAEGSGPKALARGVGTTKKRAEQEAARRAFEKLRKQGACSGTRGGR